ncbi:MAG: hypothetical protein COA66_02370 [Arcobacter sp.]|nr:MAG: hypothetical protein COA66_02370 [Arcobacter sp.]
MKQTTEQIYNLITNNNFENIKKKLEDITSRHKWQIPDRNESSYLEVINELPDAIDVIKQNIENNSFDSLPYNWRHSILDIVSQLNTYLNNVYAGHQQFIYLQDHTQTLIAYIRTYRLDFEAKRIPRYKEKIKEYKELIEKLSTLNQTLELTKVKEIELTKIIENSNEIIKKLYENLDLTESNKQKSILKIDEVNEMNNQINAILETIKEHKSSVSLLLQESKTSNIGIKDLEEEIIKFHSTINEHEVSMKNFIEMTKEEVSNYNLKTTEIINTNTKYQIEIDKQLNKAVGASLFSTFDKRKESLNKNLKYWLIALTLVIISLLSISGWIANDIVNKIFNWNFLIVKLGISFPLIYAIIFLSNRYTRERRLVEEYAFKSTISLALTPYADLVKKIEDAGSDSKYRDFLISSIENIFSIPTDKVFGFDKNTSNNSKVMDEVLDILKKTKNLGTDAKK